ncbi:DNA ligase [Microaerobacter geothermalis]|uniref:ATP-dependent DNA ligase n=1 Tax=Microaerobacter geothermalis TaxID=674972 RepID=UPI001F346C58|nr:RNA ligase family protein [Microaerobacter geothermalis]MCF6093343.1 DNA ligase [Microaerobacter geothermalis]
MKEDIKPIIPFEPKRSDHVPQGNQWIAQVKWDGVRVIAYDDGKKVRLFNRKKAERTFHYPELTDIKSYCTAQTIILDGEVIALGLDGKPSFHEVMRRDGIRRMERVEQVRKLVPVTYMIFDVVYYNGKWVNDRPLKDRMEILAKSIVPNDHVQLVSSHSDGQTLFDVVKEHKMEGIVTKDLDSTYLIGGKDQRWQKIKNYRELIAVVGGATLREGCVNAVLLGLYDEKGQLWYIGHAGTGKLKRSEWCELTERVKPLIIKERPFANRPERLKETVWVKPDMTAKIQFSEWTRGRTLRQPIIQAFVDIHPETCIFQSQDWR